VFNRFRTSVAFILAVTAFGKILALLGMNEGLAGNDPLLPLSKASVFWIAAAAEGWLAIVLFKSQNDMRDAWLILGSASLFLLYRAFLLALPPQASCGCLGALTEYLPLQTKTVDKVLWLIIMYMMSGATLACLRFSTKEPHSRLLRQ
jgi:hypothetical protein